MYGVTPPYLTGSKGGGISPGTEYHETLSALKDKRYMYIHLYKIAMSQFHAGSGMCP